MKDLSLEKTVSVKVMVFNSPDTRIDIKHFKISFNMVTLLQEEQDKLVLEMNQNISFAKVQFFLQEIFNESILCQAEHSAQMMKSLGTYENKIVVLPKLDKGTIVTALHRKFNSICSQNTKVFVVKLYDVDMELSYTYNCVDEDEQQYDELPTIDEWMGEYSYWDEPWWDRSDQLTWDLAVNDHDQWVASRGKNFDGSDINATEIFDEIEMQVLDLFQESMIQAGIMVPKEADVIEVDFEKKRIKDQKEKWKPTVV
jgi:hypothetical protein